MRRFEEAFSGWTESRLTQEEAARMLGVRARSFRRYVDEVVRLETLCKESYDGWSVAHFHERYRERHGGARSYTWTKNRLQAAGLVSKGRSKGRHRKRRERAPVAGLLPHQDGSTNAGETPALPGRTLRRMPPSVAHRGGPPCAARAPMHKNVAHPFGCVPAWLRRTLAAMRKVLVVDDDSHIREVICFALRREGFAVVEARDGAAALRAFEREAPDLLILDIMMPPPDGLEVCRSIRAGGHGGSAPASVPILFLSAKDAELERIVGLEVGGDDYVVKPFSPRELVARVKAFFRRAEALADPALREIVAGPLRMNLDAWQATLRDQPLELTRTEFGLLATLAQHRGKVLNRETLMNGAYPGQRIVSDRTIDSHLRRLRAKLRHGGGDLVETVHGVGFRFMLPQPEGGDAPG